MSERPIAVIVADAPGLNLTPYDAMLDAADLLIAADGGARHLLSSNRLPHLAIGDFDSLEPHLLGQLEQDGVAIERHPVHKNETDLELALVRAVEHGAHTIVVLGALGGRPDQTLANLQLLTHPRLANCDVRLFDHGWEIFVVRDMVSFAGQPGDTVSLLPITTEVTGIVTEGLYYPLRNEALELGPARGVSNKLVNTAALIRITGGLLLVMHQLDALAGHQR